MKPAVDRPASPRRLLVVNADDFGRSEGINEAVVRAHVDGILTSASLMVAGARAGDAVARAREHPRLGVGLHLTLVQGGAVLPSSRLPGLVDEQGRFRRGAVAAGWRYYFDRSLRGSLRDEVAAQLDRFLESGLGLDHLNGHLHLHLHPVILDLVLAEAPRCGLRHLRLTRDPFWFNARLAGGRWGYRAFHGLAFALLARRARRRLVAAGLGFVPRVFGLLQDGRVDEAFLLRLLRAVPAGASELYAHPSLDGFRHELEALTSRRVKALVEERSIERVRYRDLPAPGAVAGASG